MRTASGRVVLEPSWRRQLRRIPWVFGAFLVLNLLLNGLFKSDQRSLSGHSQAYKIGYDVVISIILALAFVPTAYWMEHSAWRRMKREQQRQGKHFDKPDKPVRTPDFGED